MSRAKLSIESEQPQEVVLSREVVLSNKKSVNYPTADAYKQYDHRTHVYMKPDMYIGADTKVLREEWLFDILNNKMFTSQVDFVPGLERIFLEILTNASDNVGRSRRNGVDPGRLEIAMDNKNLSII